MPMPVYLKLVSAMKSVLFYPGEFIFRNGDEAACVMMRVSRVADADARDFSTNLPTTLPPAGTRWSSSAAERRTLCRTTV